MIEQTIKNKGKTSEEIFEISKQPEATCPMIDKIITAIESVEKLVKKPRYGWEGVDVEDLLSDVEYELFGLASDMEEIRDNVELIRTWGQEWKIEATKEES